MAEIETDENKGFVDKLIDKIEPIPVHITGSDIDRVEGTEYASFQTYRLTGLEPQPIQILAQDLKRKRSTIIINPGFTDGNNTGYVVIGDIGGVSNGQGALLACGNIIVMEHGRAVYLKGDGVHSLTVTVLDERYQ